MKNPSVEQLAEQAYREFALRDFNVKRVRDNPTCEICNDGPSVAITRWGSIKAACVLCLLEEQRRFQESIKETDSDDDQ